jgi:hypothetical protein
MRKRGQIVLQPPCPSSREGPVLEGQVQYYGPDGSYDALGIKHKGRWNLGPDIRCKNDKSPNDNAKKPDPKKQTPSFKPK